MNTHFLKIGDSTLCIHTPEEHRIPGGSYCLFFPHGELNECANGDPESYMLRLTESYGNSFTPDVASRLISNIETIERVDDIDALITDRYPTAWFNSRSSMKPFSEMSLAVFPQDGILYFVVIDFTHSEDADELIREQVLKKNIWKKAM